ncbi:MAG: apolipoprotein N-acyltransferase [Methylophilaceae bacterium]|nr:apolipoprotein N-acyltransferase [Methylophilaceae bacterium]
MRHGAALLLGAASVFGYAPFYLYPLTLLALAGLFRLWHDATTPAMAAWLGFGFGLGLFGTGVSWIYISLHDFGGMPMLPAAFATALFCAFLALFPALVGYLAVRVFPRQRAVAIPLIWAAMEWGREWILTGFPWLAVGYSQIPYSPLSGIAPVFGIHGVSLATAACAAVIAAWLAGRLAAKRLLLLLGSFWLIGSALLHVEWSTPQGPPLSFSLLQGNIAQDLKWREDMLQHTLHTYQKMVQASRAKLIVLPEMAFPVLLENLPQGYLDALAHHARSLGGNLLVGVPEAARHNGTTLYFNSMLSYGTAPTQVYRKSHLVPFGEFIPFKPVFGWIYRELLHIPLADLAPGSKNPTPMTLSGQKVALNICYEDVFGNEIIRQLPEATLLVNVSNDAWYGNSLAAHQHLQMSQARALETSRVMLRATNTGATAAIGRDGRVIAELPHFTTAALEGEAQGYVGATPYVRWGNVPAISLIFLALGVLWGRRNK